MAYNKTVKKNSRGKGARQGSDLDMYLDMLREQDAAQSAASGGQGIFALMQLLAQVQGQQNQRPMPQMAPDPIAQRTQTYNLSGGSQNPYTNPTGPQAPQNVMLMQLLRQMNPGAYGGFSGPLGPQGRGGY